ncbi:hypothetical protein GLOIN_2v1483744 [Rhizophagus irregularis DAOM 181602=DAOM 197198]|uniref:Uncharacterized protein n=1 Tax=Rhizophagus irregularis (strain DAOM 181602 / DAOM 197198 / MUCL 43194) TaxID=747089 RepID=A0A2P4PGV5_RHIID|nr:hypothetical protein GLOIN_2v1483744 [Rhizophagus irregularis DAOM 181602=DAOM 197198]POG64622.1 hypothetical protein GLOIN_2v1483744 [Rhizophagus irregularis DAOM 181602=DAOM 197198]|eukprot:XP_025171488.1 hypothetical protein GLOIN_2v1483744 [Rhizophagus irregularis DAOM 181602=DAOM 197198]
MFARMIIAMIVCSNPAPVISYLNGLRLYGKLLKDQCVQNFLDNWYISPLQFDLESDKDEQVNIKLNVGDVVNVLEDITPLGNISQDATDMVTRVSYLRIIAIILH